MYDATRKEVSLKDPSFNDRRLFERTFRRNIEANIAEATQKMRTHEKYK